MPGPPFRSALEPFLEFITQERRKRLTWKAIAESIRLQGTPCTPQGVQDYFRRRKAAGKKKLPLGFEPEPDQPQPATTQRAAPQHAKKEESLSEKKRREDDKEDRKPKTKIFNDTHII